MGSLSSLRTMFPQEYDVNDNTSIHPTGLLDYNMFLYEKNPAQTGSGA